MRYRAKTVLTLVLIVVVGIGGFALGMSAGLAWNGNGKDYAEQSKTGFSDQAVVETVTETVTATRNAAEDTEATSATSATSEPSEDATDADSVGDPDDDRLFGDRSSKGPATQEGDDDGYVGW